MLARWISILDTYDYHFEHRQGSKHGNADAMSRKPCKQCKREGCYEPVGAVRRIPERNEMDKLSFTDWCDAMSDDDRRELQQADPAISRIVALLLSFPDRKPPWRDVARDGRDVKTLWVQWHNLVIRDDILYRRWRATERMPWIYQYVTPPTLRRQIMHFVHDKRLAGHLGVAKTVHNVRQRFYWPGHKEDIKRWCRRCNVCAAQKPRPGPRRAPLQQRPTGDRLERIALDVLGPLPLTERQNQYILVATDYFSKWTMAWAMPDHTAMTIAEKLVLDWFLLFGCPVQIHTDQGRDFQSKLMKELLKLLEIDQTRTVPYRPQSDGQTERFNRTLLSMLTSFVDENQENWDEVLPYVLSAYRATMHETTNCSPNLMFLGRENRMPVDLLFGSPPGDGNPPACPNEYVEWVRDATQVAHEYAREHSGVAAERQKRYYDQRTASRKFKVGDWIRYYYPPEGEKKLKGGWLGPYLITKITSEVNYEIQGTPKGRAKVVHVDQLKTYEGDPPRESWVGKPEDGPENEEHVVTSGEQPEEAASSDETGSEIGEAETPDTIPEACIEADEPIQDYTPNLDPKESIETDMDGEVPELSEERHENELRRSSRPKRPPRRLDL